MRTLQSPSVLRDTRKEREGEGEKTRQAESGRVTQAQRNRQTRRSKTGPRVPPPPRAFCPIIILRRTTSSGKVAVAADTPATDPMQSDTTFGTFSLPVLVW